VPGWPATPRAVGAAAGIGADRHLGAAAPAAARSPAGPPRCARPWL